MTTNENLDCMNESELRAYAANLRLLAQYAMQKAQAMHWRGKGNIRYALVAEANLDKIYAKLPLELRW